MKMSPFIGPLIGTMKGDFFMGNKMKLDQKTKLIMVKEHLLDGLPISEMSKKYNYSCSGIKYCCELYRRHGESPFVEESRRKYSREDKLKAIQRIKNGEAIRQVALDMAMHDPTIIRDWIHKYETDGEQAIKDTYSRNHYLLHEDRLDKIAEKKLLDRLEYLEVENAYLKKSYSLILKRSKQRKKK